MNSEFCGATDILVQYS